MEGTPTVFPTQGNPGVGGVGQREETEWSLPFGTVAHPHVRVEYPAMCWKCRCSRTAGPVCPGLHKATRGTKRQEGREEGDPSAALVKPWSRGETSASW